jgi:hypothetical protein
MKKVSRICRTLFLAGILLSISSCEKEGPTGPQGPTGASGSSNVTARTFYVNSWGFSSPYHYANLAVPEITSGNLDAAAVLVYFSTGGNWLALPYTQYDSPYNYYMGFNTGAGNVQVTWFYDFSGSSGSNPNSYYSTTVECKVVVIPPAMKKNSLDYKNYAEVKAVYNLED